MDREVAREEEVAIGAAFNSQALAVDCEARGSQRLFGLSPRTSMVLAV